jgi:hypothetical protein
MENVGIFYDHLEYIFYSNFEYLMDVTIWYLFPAWVLKIWQPWSCRLLSKWTFYSPFGNKKSERGSGQIGFRFHPIILIFDKLLCSHENKQHSFLSTAIARHVGRMGGPNY